MATEDRMSAVYDAVPTQLSPAWHSDGHFHFDRNLLLSLFSAQIDRGSTRVAAAGGWAIALDVWAATELRRAGVESDLVWPRASVPRTMPWDLSRAQARLRLSRNAGERAAQERILADLERI